MDLYFLLWKVLFFPVIFLINLKIEIGTVKKGFRKIQNIGFSYMMREDFYKPFVVVSNEFKTRKNLIIGEFGSISNCRDDLDRSFSFGSRMDQACINLRTQAVIDRILKLSGRSEKFNVFFDIKSAENNNSREVTMIANWGNRVNLLSFLLSFGRTKFSVELIDFILKILDRNLDAGFNKALS